jgi:hypothetical protein
MVLPDPKNHLASLLSKVEAKLKNIYEYHNTKILYTINTKYYNTENTI